jgi:hypothetical protein
MTVSNQMAAVPARILQHPRLSGGAAMSGGSTFEPKSGKWDLRGYKLKNVPTLTRLSNTSLNPLRDGEFSSLTISDDLQDPEVVY